MMMMSKSLLLRIEKVYNTVDNLPTYGELHSWVWACLLLPFLTNYGKLKAKKKMPRSEATQMRKRHDDVR
jgi:hypothetical protein